MGVVAETYDSSCVLLSDISNPVVQGMIQEEFQLASIVSGEGRKDQLARRRLPEGLFEGVFETSACAVQMEVWVGEGSDFFELRWKDLRAINPKHTSRIAVPAV